MRTAMRTDELLRSDSAISAYGPARSTVEGTPLSPDELRKIDAYWRASLYLCLGMLYLKSNPLLREPLTLEHIKPRLLGHWGSDAGHAFTYIHFNRLIKKYDLNAIFVSGPGHGAPAVLSQAYLEGTYSEIYPENSEDATGLQRFFRQFSFPGGIGSHATPETPGSIHEGGELGYSISHAYGTVFDNPVLITLVMVGDGESETGPLATSWHSNKFLNPVTRPILSKAAIPKPCTRQWPPRWTIASWRFEISSRRLGKAERRFGPAGRWSSCAVPKAGPRRGRSKDTISKAFGGPTKSRLPMSRATHANSSYWNTGCAATSPRSCSMTTGACSLN
jgi:XFP N-terminal domain